MINHKQGTTTLIYVKGRHYEFLKTIVVSRPKLIYFGNALETYSEQSLKHR